MSDDNKPDDTSPAGLRATIERLESKLSKAETTIREQAFQLAGIDPKKGIGKAVAATFTGEPSKEAILAYAKAEYDFEPAPAPEENGDGGEAEQAAAVERAQQLAEKATQGGTPPPANMTRDQRIAKAESEGDWNTAMALKAQQTSESIRPTKG